MRSEGYGSWVCVSVCLCVCLLLYISLLEYSFVLQTKLSTKRVVKVKNIRRFSLKTLPVAKLDALPALYTDEPYGNFWGEYAHAYHVR